MTPFTTPPRRKPSMTFVAGLEAAFTAESDVQTIRSDGAQVPDLRACGRVLSPGRVLIAAPLQFSDQEARP